MSAGPSAEDISHFKSRVSPALHLVPEESRLSVRAKTLANFTGYHFVRIRCDELRSKEQLFECLAAQIPLPKYFGKNWDALEECLQDFRWQRAPGYLLIFEDFSAVRELPHPDLETLLQIFEETAHYWRNKNVPFHFILCGNHDMQRSVMDVLSPKTAHRCSAFGLSSD